MRRSTSLAIVLTCSVIISVLFTSVSIFASENSTQKLTIVATIIPMRSIIVDNNFVIQKVYSNTNEEVRPTVFLMQLDGTQVSYSTAVQLQYESLKSQIDFSKPGLLYERDNRPLQALFKRISGFIRHIFSFL
jgi:hypothetical protein